MRPETLGHVVRGRLPKLPAPLDGASPRHRAIPRRRRPRVACLAVCEDILRDMGVRLVFLSVVVADNHDLEVVETLVCLLRSDDVEHLQ